MLSDRQIDRVPPDATHSCHRLEPYWPACLNGMSITDGAETPLDDLFIALDGRTVVYGDRAWRLHLYSVRDINGAVWIQLDLVGAPTYVLTLCEPLRANAADVLATLTRYLGLTKDAADSVVFDRILGGSLTATPSRGASQYASE